MAGFLGEENEMTLDDAKTVALYFLFNGDLLSFKDNAEAFVEASKTIENETRNVLKLRQSERKEDGNR
jgi:hypothetical protein